GLERERMDRDSIRAALVAKTKEFEQERASATVQSGGLAERLRAREIALAENAQQIKSLTDRTQRFNPPPKPIGPRPNDISTSSMRSLSANVLSGPQTER